MITSSTLFILGAGANVPYGFPDARNLRIQICKNYLSQYLNLFPKDRGYNKYDREFTLKVQSNSAKDFVAAFEKSNLKSIDLFLSLNPEFSDHGKRAIVLSIIKAENGHINRKVLYGKDDWFQYLFNKSMEGIFSPEKLLLYQKNNIAFITFNYDRLLQQYFIESLLNSFLKNQKEIFEIFQNIPVNNIYGKIADLPLPYIKKFVKYGEEINFDQLEEIKENINVINYERNSENSWSDLIKSYERIFLLGFGYADENMRLLNIQECLVKGQVVIGTAYQNTPNEILNIKRKFWGSWLRNADKDLIIINTDALTLLREYL